MDEALHFFRVYETWIYLLLGLGGVIYLRRFLSAWQELRGAIFGLERENAQNRLNQSASVLALLLMMALGEFVVVSFVAPLIPESSPIPTPTLNPLATPTATLESALSGEVEAQAVAAATQLPTVEMNEDGCLAGEVEIASPRLGEEISGVIQIQGAANIPDFGFYKLEYARREEPLWLTIQAGRDPVEGSEDDHVLIEQWDTSLVTPGEYILQLVLVNHAGQALPPCRVPVRIAPP